MRRALNRMADLRDEFVYEREKIRKLKKVRDERRGHDVERRRELVARPGDEALREPRRDAAEDRVVPRARTDRDVLLRDGGKLRI